MADTFFWIALGAVVGSLFGLAILLYRLRRSDTAVRADRITFP
jgi:hypothetical protein